MPYKNEHTARQTDPSKYEDFKRFAPKNAKVVMILGIKDGKSEVQSLRVSADDMTVDEFRAWLKEHDFKVSEIEEATKKSFESFARWVPVTFGDCISKGGEGEDIEKATAKIGGVCSTDDLDFEGESIAQDGLDWSYFLQHGWFNHEHQQGPSAVLGHPVKVEPIDEKRTRVEGLLYLAKDLGKQVYETAMALKKAGGDRSLGFSIEGQVIERCPKSPKRVLRAKVLNVAITSAPVNPHTNLELIARSMGASAGYQSAGMVDADASLSALMEQDLQGRKKRKKIASATFDAEVQKATMSREQVKRLLMERLPDIDPTSLDDIATKIIALAKTLQKR
jgi:hypothetical protein